MYVYIHVYVCELRVQYSWSAHTHTHTLIELHSWCIIRVAVCRGGWCWGWPLPQLSLHCVHYIHCWWEPGTPLHLYSTPYECAGEINTPFLITRFWGENFESYHNFSSMLSLLKHATDLYMYMYICTKVSDVYMHHVLCTHTQVAMPFTLLH